MALQFGVLTRNRRLDSIEVELGTTPKLRLFVGAQPANCAAANSGTILATFNLPSDWMAVASGGIKNIAGGPWQDTSADNSGTAGHFRIHNAGDTACEMQGSVGMGSGDLQLDNNVIVSGQTVSITAFSITDGNS